MQGIQLFCYLQLTCQNLKEIFRKMRGAENFKPADFGTIIVAGQGQPSAEVISEMYAEYNIIDVPRPKPPFKIDTSQPSFFDEELEK